MAEVLVKLCITYSECDVTSNMKLRRVLGYRDNILVIMLFQYFRDPSHHAMPSVIGCVANLRRLTT